MQNSYRVKRPQYRSCSRELLSYFSFQDSTELLGFASCGQASQSPSKKLLGLRLISGF